MNLTPRAARQLQALRPSDVAIILDQLRDRPHVGGTSIVEVKTPGGTVRCFIGPRRDGQPVLLGIVAARPRAP